MLWMHGSILGCIYVPVSISNLEIFPETTPTGNSTVYPFSVIENTITIQ
jgi:hypothetical protein